ncbi:hypothetical protein GHK48_27110 [Sinorhizobium fredii]|uniref:Uncharacterized protein n=1 Tax=Rhizobium fredii TaxID=380 RepID=A0A844AF34_RHIFR|nr:hypothetical protein [Sinorhizobium fredii]MQX11814.1 hypothetical protein [Sinorhizobium fredii]GEC31717.1 hypothetical protein EFR01_18880 [Sinorhizobium fredii]GLS09041.1 hypothetical protein GCM10007864_26710 [Sinorhizobium fredii]
MSATRKSCQVTILVKALPRPSTGHSETVCCAGITADGEWKRLYPIRYRHGGETFGRWDKVAFDYVPNSQDKRAESCKVLQGTIKNIGKCASDEKRHLLEPLITPTMEAAAELGRSLTAIRPQQVRFIHRPKPATAIQQEAAAYERSARQANMLDQEVEPFEPTPHMLAFSYTDQSGVRHTHQCGDWETHTAFWKWRQSYGEARTLQMLKEKYEGEYVEKGIVFILGTLAKRPKQWTLLGVVRLDKGAYQTGFAF